VNLQNYCLKNNFECLEKKSIKRKNIKLGVDWREILKRILNEWCGMVSTGLSDSGQMSLAISLEHSDKTSDSVKSKEFRD
jgi:hypothetical protein